jgi:uncharacterized protein YbjQ (UPF0145 family)
VFGLIVRARNVFSNIGAQLMTVAGGEVAGYTKLLTDSRNQARQRMWREARAWGANAVVAMRLLHEDHVSAKPAASADRRSSLHRSPWQMSKSFDWGCRALQIPMVGIEVWANGRRR